MSDRKRTGHSGMAIDIQYPLHLGVKGFICSVEPAQL